MDLCYVVLTERSRNRAVLYHGCIEFILKENVGYSDKEKMRRLKLLQQEQRGGIAVLESKFCKLKTCFKPPIRIVRSLDVTLSPVLLLSTIKLYGKL